MELERTIYKLEQQQADMAQAALRFEEATGSVPDPNLPIANQLEEAIRRIKDHVKIIVGCRQENKNLKTQVAELKRALEEHETKNTQKAKIINELRLRLPVSERQAVTEHVESVVTRPQDYEAKKALQIAQSTISSLQQMITKKEESILKYQELLKVALRSLYCYRDDVCSIAYRFMSEYDLVSKMWSHFASTKHRWFPPPSVTVYNQGVSQKEHEIGNLMTLRNSVTRDILVA